MRSRAGTTVASTAGSTADAPASVGDQTMFAPPSSEPVLVPDESSSSRAAVDSVSGRSNESFSSPPSRTPSPMTAMMAMNQATRAMTGRRTAHADKPGMTPTFTSSDETAHAEASASDCK